VGCRQRKPVSELVRVRWTPEGTLEVTGAAGTAGRTGPVVKGSPVPKTGKGQWLCPEVVCADQALRARKRSRGQPKAREVAGDGLSADRQGVSGTAREWLEAAARMAQHAIEQRESGLRRRRLEKSPDGRIEAWKVLGARIVAALTADPVRETRGHRRG